VLDASSNEDSLSADGYLSGLNPFYSKQSESFAKPATNLFQLMILPRALHVGTDAASTVEAGLRRVAEGFIDRVKVEPARPYWKPPGNRSRSWRAAPVCRRGEFRRAFRRYAGMAPGPIAFSCAPETSQGPCLRAAEDRRAHSGNAHAILDSCVNGVTLADPDQETRRLYMRTKSFSALPLLA